MHPITTSALPTLFDLESGEITEHFKNQLNISGITIDQQIEGVDLYHILNVDGILQTNGCFQVDCDFYKKGNISALNLTHEQASLFLDDEYRSRQGGDLMPDEMMPADAIVGCGVEATMHKRFDAIKQACDYGYIFTAFYFIAKDQEMIEMIQQMIHANYAHVIRDVPVRFIAADVDKNILEVGLNALKQQCVLNENYIVVTDITLASKIENIVRPILEGNFLGVVATSIKDWHVDMGLYGYPQAFIGDLEKAAIAWASSAWNFKARQVHAEKSAYLSTMASAIGK